jgi:iron complex outermembrane receptor protein
VFVYVATDATFVGAEAEAGYDVWRMGDRTVRLEGAYDIVRGDTDLGAPARIRPGRRPLGWSTKPRP